MPDSIAEYVFTGDESLRITAERDYALGQIERSLEIEAELLATVDQLKEELRCARALAVCCAAEDCYSRTELVEIGRQQMESIATVLSGIGITKNEREELASVKS